MSVLLEWERNTLLGVGAGFLVLIPKRKRGLVCVAAHTREAAARLMSVSDETLGPMTGNHERATN